MPLFIRNKMGTLIGLLITMLVGGGIAFGQGYNMIFNIVQSLCTWNNGAALTVTSIVYSYIRPIGLSLALGYSIIEILDGITRAGANNATPEIVVMPLIKFSICFLCIKYGIEIISTALGASNGFVNWVDNAIAGYSFGELASAGGSTVNGTLTKILVEWIPAIMSLLSQIIAGVIIGVQLISIRIEVLVRSMFLPVAVAGISQGGAGSPGMRFVKNLIGNIFTLGAVLVIVKLTYMVTGDIQAFQIESAGLAQTIFMSMYAIVFNGVIGPFACIGAITTVKSLIREAFSG